MKRKTQLEVSIGDAVIVTKHNNHGPSRVGQRGKVVQFGVDSRVWIALNSGETICWRKCWIEKLNGETDEISQR